MEDEGDERDMTYEQLIILSQREGRGRLAWKGDEKERGAREGNSGHVEFKERGGRVG
jgi:hypothetical protein